MQTELSRLADVCRNESVPDAFQTFVAGIPTPVSYTHLGIAFTLRHRRDCHPLGQHLLLPILRQRLRVQRDGHFVVDVYKRQVSTSASSNMR